MNRFLVLLVAFFIASCGEQQSLEPQAQKEFKQLVSSLSEKYEEVERSGNALAEDEFDKRFEKELKKTNRRATSWVGTFVSSSGDNDQLIIDLENDNQTYHLVLVDPKVIGFTKSLKNGDALLFTGDLGSEVSLTVSGALDEPEFRFYPFKIKRPEDNDWMSQDKETVDRILAEEKASNADAYIEVEVAAQCEKVIRAQLKFPGSADFSWLGEAIKQQDGVWMYKNTVEAKNALGNEIPYRFYCLAKGKYVDGSAQVEITRSEFIDG